MKIGELEKVYKTIIRPGTEYCSIVYGSLIPKYVSNKLESVQKQAYKIMHGWGVDYNKLVEEGRVETLEARRTDKALKFALTNRKKERFRKWFPRNQIDRMARETTRRPYKERFAKTERTKNNPIQFMIRLLNDHEMK